MTATDDGNNPGPGSYNVSKVNIISSTGKQSKDMTKHPWRSINLVEGMGLESSEARFITGDIVILDAVGFLSQNHLRLPMYITLNCSEFFTLAF